MAPTLGFGFCVLTVLAASAQTYPDLGGAQIEKPFQLTISGAVCFSGTGPLAGNAWFHFPTQDKKALSFVIGRSAPRQDKDDPFNGPGTYPNIGIFVKAQNADEDNLFGYGQVVVNDDGRSGNFNFNNAAAKAELQKTGQKPDQKKDKKKDDKPKGDGDSEDNQDDSGVVSGTWDCGRKLPHSESK